MGDELFLTDAQVSRLTKKVQRAAQVRALRTMGIEHRQRPDGSVVVLRSHIDKVFDGAAQDTSRTPRTVEPNWAAI